MKWNDYKKNITALTESELKEIEQEATEIVKDVVKIPVIALKNKSKENRFLAAHMDVGDWEDPELDVTLNDIGNAFLIWRKDLTQPTEKDVEEVKQDSIQYKKYMIEKFGKSAMISYDVEEWLKHYEPINLEISAEQFELLKKILNCR